MDIQTLRSKSMDELAEALAAQRERLQSLRFDLAGGKVKNIHAVHEARRAIARILTLVRERQNSA